jgi:hypothetical protein
MEISTKPPSEIDPSLVNIVALTVGDDSYYAERSLTYSLRSNRTLSAIAASHWMASKLYDLDLESECAEFQNDHFTKEFRDNIRSAFHNRPDIMEFACLGDFNEDDAEYENSVNSDFFAVLYLEIAKLVDPDLKWVFHNTSDYTKSIGGSGLFYD